MIPGYIHDTFTNTLADDWPKPAAELPARLWPAQALYSISPDPMGWLTVEEQYFTPNEQGGKGCVLISPENHASALQDTSWIGRTLGNVGVWSDGTFVNGLTSADENLGSEFFVHARRPSGAILPVIEINLPFLWYWDAFPVTDGWSYLNRAGRNQDLIRYQVTDESWKVEVRALELRQFLASSNLSAVVQIDHTLKTDAEEFQRVDDELENDWAHLAFHALLDERPNWLFHPRLQRPARLQPDDLPLKICRLKRNELQKRGGVHKLRLERGLTKESLALEAGLSRNMVISLEWGNKSTAYDGCGI